MLLADALRLYESERQDALSPYTLANYRHAIQSLKEFGVKSTKGLARPKVGRWITAQLTTDLEASTVNTRLTAVCSLATFLHEKGIFPKKRLLGLRKLRVKTGPPPTPTYLTREEVARFRAGCMAVDDQLDLAVSLSIFAGLRFSEMRHLHREDLAIEPTEPAPYLRVLRERNETKTRRDRTVPLPRAYAASLRARGLSSSGPLFPARISLNRGPYLSERTLEVWFIEAREISQLHHVTWHILRHTFASWLRQHGVEISRISGFMGNTAKVCEMFYAAMGHGGDTVVDRAFEEKPGDAA